MYVTIIFSGVSDPKLRCNVHVVSPRGKPSIDAALALDTALGQALEKVDGHNKILESLSSLHFTFFNEKKRETNLHPASLENIFGKQLVSASQEPLDYTTFFFLIQKSMLICLFD